MSEKRIQKFEIEKNILDIDIEDGKYYLYFTFLDKRQEVLMFYVFQKKIVKFHSLNYLIKDIKIKDDKFYIDYSGKFPITCISLFLKLEELILYEGDFKFSMFKKINLEDFFENIIYNKHKNKNT